MIIHVNDLEIIFLSQQSGAFCIEGIPSEWLCIDNRVATRTFSLRHPRLERVLSLPDRHSALSVQHIESADRKRGSRICLEFPLLSPYLCRPPTIACFPLKLTIQISPRVLDYDLRLGDGPRASSMVFAECQISAPKERTGYCTIVQFVQFRDIAHFLKK